MDRETWCPVIHGVAKCRTRLGDWTELSGYQVYFWSDKNVEILIVMVVAKLYTKNNYTLGQIVQQVNGKTSCVYGLEVSTT